MTDLSCGNRKYECCCVRAAVHAGPHACPCRGMWEEDGSIVAFPSPFEDDLTPAEIEQRIQSLGLTA